MKSSLNEINLVQYIWWCISVVPVHNYITFACNIIMYYFCTVLVLVRRSTDLVYYCISNNYLVLLLYFTCLWIGSADRPGPRHPVGWRQASPLCPTDRTKRIMTNGYFQNVAWQPRVCRRLLQKHTQLT